MQTFTKVFGALSCCCCLLQQGGEAFSSPTIVGNRVQRQQQERQQHRRGRPHTSVRPSSSYSGNRRGRFAAAVGDDVREKVFSAGAPRDRREFARGALGSMGAAAALLWSEAGSADEVEAGAAKTGEEEGAAVAEPSKGSALDYTLPYGGKDFPVSKFLGKATLIINGKLDDPITLSQMSPIVATANKFASQGLRVIIVPTDQGTFEPDEDRVIKIKYYQFYGFGQYPRSFVADKMDIVGSSGVPLYKYMCRTLKNPYGVGRVTLNFEKFLLDAEGIPVRRYPRKFATSEFEDDIKAVLEGKPLPAETRAFSTAWVRAEKEALQSEYAFKQGLNYYNNPPNAEWIPGKR